VATPREKMPTAVGSDPSSAATPEAQRSFWPLSLSDIETYLYRLMRPAEPKTEPKAESRTRQPAEKPVAEQPR